MRRILLQDTTELTGAEAGVILLVVFLLIAAYVTAIVLVAVWLNKDAKRRRENNALWVTLWVLGMLLSPLPGLIVLLLYFVVRGPESQFDPGPFPMASAAFGQAQPIAPSWAPASPALNVDPAMPWTPPPPAKVRCPRCHNVFEYRRMPTGPTHVKCPGCGEEGNI